MARLLVTIDADNDSNEIISYLQREAGPRIADEYGRRFGIPLTRIVDFPESGAPRRNLGPDTRIGVVAPLYPDL
jgi:plasmid stabilization system protein ParE